MTQYRYEVVCNECGQVVSSTDGDGRFDRESTAYRRAGFHEGMNDGDHTCEVERVEKTNEYRCPVCHTKCVGERERDEHARSEPGVSPDSFTRV